MSLKTLPLLFINLGGEMMYILDQRLRAQNIPSDKALKVIHDIVGTMYNKRFIEELFKPQELYSRKAMRTVFDRLAHASIMRLNAASMDKLYDLMTMVFKYQISLCPRPQDILLVTLNHVDAIRVFVQDNPAVRSQVDNVFRQLIQHYGNLSSGEFMLIRQTLLNFFQDMHIRVSLFLKDKSQNTNGRFVLPLSGPVPFGFDVPGTVKLYNEKGQQIKQSSFDCIGRYAASSREGSIDLRGDRGTKLGTNIYNVSRKVEAVDSPGSSKQSMSSVDMDHMASNPQAKAQLDLLCHLIGGEKKSKNDFRLSLFDTREEEEESTSFHQAAAAGTQYVSIDASTKKESKELSRIMCEMKVDPRQDSNEDDLLDLLDSAY